MIWRNFWSIHLLIECRMSNHEKRHLKHPYWVRYRHYRLSLGKGDQKWDWILKMLRASTESLESISSLRIFISPILDEIRAKMLSLGKGDQKWDWILKSHTASVELKDSKSSWIMVIRPIVTEIWPQKLGDQIYYQLYLAPGMRFSKFFWSFHITWVRWKYHLHYSLSAPLHHGECPPPFFYRVSTQKTYCRPLY